MSNRRGPTVTAVAVALAGCLVLAAPAGAEEVTGAELRDLAQRAPSDPAALARLRRVDRVDGQPLAVDRALSHASGADLRVRLETLAGGGPGAGPAPSAAAAAAARDEATRILEGRRYNRSPVPRPLRGALRWLGDRLRPIGEPLGRAWDRITGNVWAMGLLAAAVAGLALLVSTRMAHHRTAAGVRRAGAGRRSGRDADPDELDRAALAAERAGDLDTAVRLRFRAGVLRLDRAGLVHDQPALTAGALTRQVPSPHLRALAGTFEEVAYGGRPATPADVDQARAGWPAVLDEARA
jgi:hypothetical protein